MAEPTVPLRRAILLLAIGLAIGIVMFFRRG